MPHHLGIHAGGIVITEKPVTHYTALHRPPKGFPVTQFSMLEAEDLGLHKFDLLSQRGLGHIRDAVELVNGQACKMKTECLRTRPRTTVPQGSCTSSKAEWVDDNNLRCDLRPETCEAAKRSTSTTSPASSRIPRSRS
jgi:hypothetical protein